MLLTEIAEDREAPVGGQNERFYSLFGAARTNGYPTGREGGASDVSEGSGAGVK